MKSDQAQRTILSYSGHVQGVGFRYGVMQLARGYEVSGFVRNEPDGRVLLEVEGHPPEIEAFLAAIADRMVGYIRKIDRQDETGPRRHRGFTIR
jgi:acylphosphatase